MSFFCWSVFKFIFCLSIFILVLIQFTCIFVILDDVDRLNAEEKAFIEDPANEEFFDPPSAEKRSREALPSVTSTAKKMKPSNDEVSRRVRNSFQ